MKRLLALLLVAALCVGMTACAFDTDQSHKKKEQTNIVETDRMAQNLCGGVWVSADHRTTVTIPYGFYTDYPTLTFFENGTCEYSRRQYKDDQLETEDILLATWTVESGWIAVSPSITDPYADTLYYNYVDGVLMGSADYCDHPFTYTRNG